MAEVSDATPEVLRRNQFYEDMAEAEAKLRKKRVPVRVVCRPRLAVDQCCCSTPAGLHLALDLAARLLR